MQQEQHQSAFNGVWIPARIFESKEISWMEKCLLAQIDFLSKEDRACSNEYLAHVFGSSASSIANQICRLRKLGLIQNVKSDDGKRHIRVSFSSGEITERSTQP